MEGETWEELEDRASRWLNGEDVIGPWGRESCPNDPRTREALLISYEKLVKGGDLLAKRISIGDTDSDGVTYREIPPDKRLLESANREFNKRSEELGVQSRSGGGVVECRGDHG